MLEPSSVSQGELTVVRPQLLEVSGFLSIRPAAAVRCVRTANDRGTPLLCMSKVGNETCYFLIPNHLLTFIAVHCVAGELGELSYTRIIGRRNQVWRFFIGSKREGFALIGRSMYCTYNFDRDWIANAFVDNYINALFLQNLSWKTHKLSCKNFV